jgi:riboflavin synthase
MGGHFVQGHVDTVAELIKREEDGEAVTLRLKPRDKQVMRYIVEKGYVTLDGASLTVTKENEEWFEIMLIAYTQSKIVTALKKEGEYINVEVDQIGKYVEKAVEGYFAQGTGGEITILEKMVERLVEAKLQKIEASVQQIG